MSAGKIQPVNNLLSDHWLKLDDFSQLQESVHPNSDIKEKTFATLKLVGAKKSDQYRVGLLFDYLEDLRVSFNDDGLREETIKAELESFLELFNDESISKEAKLLAIRQVSLNLQDTVLDRSTCLSAIFALKMAKSGQQQRQLHQKLLNQLLDESIHFIKATRLERGSAPLTEYHCYELKKLVAQEVGFDLTQVKFRPNILSLSPKFLSGEKDSFVECVSILCSATQQIGYLAEQLENDVLDKSVALDCTSLRNSSESLKLVTSGDELKSGQLKDQYRVTLIDHFLPAKSDIEGEQAEPETNVHGYQVYLSFRDHRARATERVEGELHLMTKHGLRLQVSDSRGATYSPNLSQMSNVCIKSLSADKKLLLGLQHIEQVIDLKSCINFKERYLADETQFPKCVAWQLKKSLQQRIEQLIAQKSIPELQIFSEDRITEVPFNDFISGIKMEVQFRDLMTFEALDELKDSDISMLWPEGGDTNLSIKRRDLFQKRLEQVIGENPCSYQPIYEKHFQVRWHKEQFKQVYELASQNAFKKHLEKLETEEELLAVFSDSVLKHGDEKHLVDFFDVYLQRLSEFYKPTGIPVSHLVKMYQQPLSVMFKTERLKIAFIASMCGSLPKLETQEKLFEFISSFTSELALLGDENALDLINSLREAWAERVRRDLPVTIDEAALVKQLNRTESKTELFLLEPLVSSDVQCTELIKVLQAKEIKCLVHHDLSLQTVIEFSEMLPEKTLSDYVSKGKVNKLAMEAVKTNNLDAFKYLLKEDANINYVDAKGFTLLHHAIEQGNTDIFKFIIEAGGYNYSNTYLKGTKNVYQLAKQFERTEMVSELEKAYPRFKPRPVYRSSSSGASYSGGASGSDFPHIPGTIPFTNNGAANLLLTQAALTPVCHGHHHCGGGLGGLGGLGGGLGGGGGFGGFVF